MLCSAPETQGEVPQQSQQPSSALFWDFPEFRQIFLQLQVSYFLKKSQIQPWGAFRPCSCCHVGAFLLLSCHVQPQPPEHEGTERP